MKTINRQAASSSPTHKQIEAMGRAIHALWSETPNGEPQHRESLLVQLIHLESDVDLLRIRSAIGEFRSEDANELNSCAEKLAELKRHWQPDWHLLLIDP